MSGFRKRGDPRQFNISHLGAAAQEQIRATLGDAEFKRLSGKKVGRYQVSPVVERVVDGVIFDSKWESTVYKRLVAEFGRQAFSLQPVFTLQGGFVCEGKRYRATYYIADFLIGGTLDNQETVLQHNSIVVDAKGHRDAVYMLKRKLFMGRYGRRVREVKTQKDLEDLVLEIRKSHPCKQRQK